MTFYCDADGYHHQDLRQKRRGDTLLCSAYNYQIAKTKTRLPLCFREVESKRRFYIAGNSAMNSADTSDRCDRTSFVPSHMLASW